MGPWAGLKLPRCEERRNPHKYIGKAIKKAENNGTTHIAVIGESEAADGRYTIKSLSDGTEENATFSL